MNRFFLYTCCALIFCACHSNPIPKDIIQPTPMKELLWEMMLGGEVVSSDTNAATRFHLKDSITSEMQTILNLHKYNKSDFVRSLRFYESNPEQQAALYDSLNAYALRQQALWQKKQAKTIKKNNTVAKADSGKMIPKIDSDIRKKSDSLKRINPAKIDTNILKRVVERRKLKLNKPPIRTKLFMQPD